MADYSLTLSDGAHRESHCCASPTELRWRRCGGDNGNRNRSSNRVSGRCAEYCANVAAQIHHRFSYDAAFPRRDF